MFVVKLDEKIGPYLKTKILQKYRSVRQFCIAYLELANREADDSDEIRKLCNRFSQILKGNKSIQTYDLPYVSQLLDTSCEDILSCGETKVPLNFRRTNYNIAFSNNESDWAEYLSREDCIAAYADEFGKTVLDYAIEFKNYKFIKYLIKNGYITLVQENPNWHNFPNFGAETSIKERPYEHKTLQNEFYENKLLRSQILSLAIANNDTKALETFKAKLFPPQLDANAFRPDFKFSEYFDEAFLKDVASSQDKVFDYFLSEYTTKTTNRDKNEITWLYPFIGELAGACIATKNKNRALKVLDIMSKHNNAAFEKLHKGFLAAAKKAKDDHYSRSYQDALEMVARDYHIDEEKNFACLYLYFMRDFEPVMSHIVWVNTSSRDTEIQAKIDEVNKIYNKILELPNLIIKNN